MSRSPSRNPNRRSLGRRKHQLPAASFSQRRTKSRANTKGWELTSEQRAWLVQSQVPRPFHCSAAILRPLPVQPQSSQIVPCGGILLVGSLKQSMLRLALVRLYSPAQVILDSDLALHPKVSREP